MEALESYNQIIKDHPLLTSTEEKYLGQCIARGRRNKKASRDKLFNSNIKLVIGHASKKHKSHPYIPILDLIGSGYIGLMSAVDRFDPDNFQTRFSTYAYPWIILYVNKAIYEFNSNIKVPPNILSKRKAVHDFMDENGDISVEEACESLGLSKLEMQKVKAADTFVISLQSEIDMGSSKSSGGRLQNTLSDESRPVDEEVCINEEIMLAKESLDKMDELSKDIIQSRYLNPKRETLGDVGKRHNLSKERIRQIEVSALDDMKRHIKKKTRFQR